jgi:HEAT repeat protein
MLILAASVVLASSIAVAGRQSGSEHPVSHLVQSVDMSLAANRDYVAAGASSIPTLIKGFSSWDEVIRSQCSTSIAKIGRPALPALEEALQSPAQRVRLAAISALDQMNTYDATRLIVMAAKDDDSWVRMNVALALRDTTEPSGMLALENLSAQDDDARVRDRASQILALRSGTNGR